MVAKLIMKLSFLVAAAAFVVVLTLPGQVLAAQPAPAPALSAYQLVGPKEAPAKPVAPVVFMAVRPRSGVMPASRPALNTPVRMVPVNGFPVPGSVYRPAWYGLTYLTVLPAPVVYPSVVHSPPVVLTPVSSVH
jgi:hypothetical protein